MCLIIYRLFNPINTQIALPKIPIKQINPKTFIKTGLGLCGSNIKITSILTDIIAMIRNIYFNLLIISFYSPVDH